MAEKKIIKTTCKSCHGGCGVLVEVTDGVITHIEGNPDSTTRGTMCSKGLSSIQHIDNPYRVIYHVLYLVYFAKVSQHVDIFGVHSLRLEIKRARFVERVEFLI